MIAIHTRRALSLILAICFLLVCGASAQLFGDPHTKAQLFLEHQVSPLGEPVRGAFELVHEEGWHTYWLNGGDVGLATEAIWDLPHGWSADPLEWPTPEYIETSGLVSYAYEGRVLLPFTLHPPARVEPGVDYPIKVQLDWLECKETCVPGEATLETKLSFDEVGVDSPEAEEVRSAFAQIPPETTDLKFRMDGDTLLLSLPEGWENDGREIRFFPDSGGQIEDLSPQEVRKVGGEAWLTLKPSPTSEALPEALSGVLALGHLGEGGSYSFSSTVESASTPIVPTSAAGGGTILVTLALAFMGGIILNLMPCVFPVLSLKVLGVVEQSREEGGKAWHHGAVFTVGVLVSFWVLSGLLLIVRAAGDEVGWGYHLQNPLMIASLALLFLLISLNLFGVFEVGESLSGVSNIAEQKKGFAHSFWSGVLTTIAATPCTAPFMGGAVGFALSQPTWVALVIFTGLALGVAFPYFTLTLFPSLLKKLPKPGAWMVTFKQLLAFPMLLAVVWLLWVFGGQSDNNRLGLLMLALTGVAFACWVYGRWGSSFEPRPRRWGMLIAGLTLAASLSTGFQASLEDTKKLDWLVFEPGLVETLVAEGKPVFLDFTADWCTSCKANELVTLSRSDVQVRFQELEVVLVKADWTKKDPTITAALAEYGRAGVPLYVLYPGGGAEPVLLPEVLLPGTLFEALEKVERSKS